MAGGFLTAPCLSILTRRRTAAEKAADGPDEKKIMTDSVKFISEIRKTPGGNLDKFVAYMAAPVIKGLKPSVLMCIRLGETEGAREWIAAKKKVNEIMGLRVKELYATGGRIGVLLYRQELLERTLADPGAAELLRGFGYFKEGQPPLKRLKQRCIGSEFPHEIGIFLGYPPEDVRAFIENGGRGGVACGYWKVYYDKDEALRSFRLFDQAKERAASLFNRGVPIAEAIAMI